MCEPGIRGQGTELDGMIPEVPTSSSLFIAFQTLTTFPENSFLRAAQEQLCRKLTAFGAQTPTGKRLIVEVGESPLK